MIIRQQLARRLLLIARTSFASRTLTTTNTLLYAKPLPPRPKIDESTITENFLKGSGPGGQKINKTASAVQLVHGPTGIVLKCQATRSRIQNRKIARQLLAEKLDEMEKGEGSRTQLKAEIKRKKKATKVKKAKRKYRALEKGKGLVAEEGEEDEAGENEYEEGEDEVFVGQIKVGVVGVKQEEQPLPEWERRWRDLRGL